MVPIANSGATSGALGIDGIAFRVLQYPRALLPDVAR
jgi:hypothetical protein